LYPSWAISWAASAEDWRQLIARARAGGARVLVQVASADATRAAADAGADALIVQRGEAGGHVQGVVGLVPLLAEVRRAVSLPLLVAGGIGDPGSPRAALAGGALAVAMGPDSWQVTSPTHVRATRHACSKSELATRC
jgi:NAD(P)H-dependent flavin oxidoreductase YrpB (nitropropane dioxygenase family)